MGKGGTNSDCCFGCKTEEGTGLNAIAPLTAEFEGHRKIEGEDEGVLNLSTSSDGALTRVRAEAVVVDAKFFC